MKIIKSFISLILMVSIFTSCEMVDTSDDLIVGNYTTSSETTFETEAPQTQEVIQTTENLSDDSQEWELRELLLYSVENSMYTDTYAHDGSQITLIVPSVTYSYREMFNFLKENEYMKKNYTLAETSRDNSVYAPFENNGQHANASIEKVICGQKIDEISNADKVMYSDILISVGQEYNTYNKPNYFSVVVNSKSITKELQTMLYELLSAQVGTEIAEYAVYAETLLDDVSEFDLVDKIPTSDGRGNLIIKRTISDVGLVLELDFQDSSEFDETRYAYFDDTYETIYNDSRVTLADIFGGNFGGNDPSVDTKFFNKFMETGGRSDIMFNQAVKNRMSTIITEGTNKIYRNYQFNIDLTKGCNMALSESPYFNCNITAYFDSRENNNYVKGEGSFIAGYTDVNLCSEDEAYAELVDVAREKIDCLFPYISTNGMEYKNFYRKAYDIHDSYTATSIQVPVNTDIHITLGIKYVEEMDADGNIKETNIPLYYYSKVTFSLS